MKIRSIRLLGHQKSYYCAPLALYVCMVLGTGAFGAISWDGEGNSNWWFDPQNWSPDPANNYLPPNNSSGNLTDAQINIGITGAWNVTGEGVVYDPDNDPFFAAAAGYTYPTDSSPIEPYVGTNYGPQHLYRLYIGRNVTDGATNILRIKSGDLAISSTFIVGRSGSTLGNENLGILVMEGGRLRSPLSPMDIGQGESSGWGNGTVDYRGGIMELDLEGSNGIRVGHGGGDSMAGGKATFIMHNPSDGGYVRAWRYQSASWRGSGDGVVTAADPDGVNTGVATAEFHYENGGTRPFQIGNNLTINNGLQTDTAGTTSSRLNLVLVEAACTGADCVPNDIGLFDVDFDLGFGSTGGIITGSGEKGGYFSSADGTTDYTEGSTVSAMFGGTRYDWTITYSGNITWSDPDNSVVDTITGAGTGVDVVLMGLGSESVGTPGDFDGDGDVDGNDYLLWQRDPAVGNLSDWQANFPGALQANLGAVPEPASLALLGAAAALSLLARRHAG